MYQKMCPFLFVLISLFTTSTQTASDPLCRNNAQDAKQDIQSQCELNTLYKRACHLYWQVHSRNPDSTKIRKEISELQLLLFWGATTDKITLEKIMRLEQRKASLESTSVGNITPRKLILDHGQLTLARIEETILNENNNFILHRYGKPASWKKHFEEFQKRRLKQMLGIPFHHQPRLSPGKRQ